MISEYSSNTTTADGTEQFVANINVRGKFRFILDKVNMAANDVLEIRCYKMVLTGGTARVIDGGLFTFQDAQPADKMIFISPEIWNELTDTNAVRFSFDQTKGTGRQFAWKVLKDDDGPVLRKNAALSNFEFFMIDSADHVSPKTGLTITAERSIDGGAFAACTNSASAVANGVYKINLSASDLNGDVITLKFTATGADQQTITLLTQP
jgi:hypothetical protein